MANSDQDHARFMLDMARSDLLALQNMGDPSRFRERIFGFHAQQAIEKALKAWLAALGRRYPRSHDLSSLVGMLAELGLAIPYIADLEQFSVYAVQYRYEAYPEPEDELDRTAVVASITKLLEHVAGTITSPAIDSGN